MPCNIFLTNFSNLIVKTLKHFDLLRLRHINRGCLNNVCAVFLQSFLEVCLTFTFVFLFVFYDLDT